MVHIYAIWTDLYKIELTGVDIKENGKVGIIDVEKYLEDLDNDDITVDGLYIIYKFQDICFSDLSNFFVYI